MNHEVTMKSFDYLNNLIHGIEKNIILDSDIYLDDSEKSTFKKGIIIDRDGMIIDGNNHCIDANGKIPIFKITANNITFRNITFKNGASKKKGGAINNSHGTITFENCNFKSNQTKRDGGAIYNSEGFLTFKNCIFEENSSKWYGGAIYNSKGSLRVHESNFKNNSSLKEGSVIWNDNYIEIFDSSIKNLNSQEKIPMIYCESEDSTLDISNSTFSTNMGKIIFIQNGFCVIQSSTFSTEENNNEFIIHNKAGNLSIEKSKFYPNNKVTIYNENNIIIKKTDNLNQTIHSVKPIKYKHEKISEHSKGFDYLTNLINSNDNFVSLDCDIIMEEMEQNFYEGGIELNQSEFTLDGKGHFIDASQLSRVFYVTGKNITFKNIIFKNGKYWKNQFDGESNGGGAIYALHDTTITIDNCQFINNSSRNSAGAILNKGEIKEVINSKFINNNSKMNGGCIYNQNNDLNLNKCIFKDNTSKNGGAIYNINASLVLENDCVFENNSSKNNGGSIYNENGNLLRVTDGRFIKNNSKGDGGVIFNNGVSHIYLKNSIFEYNESTCNGGVICNYNVGCIDFIDDSTFKNNSSRGNGGVIYLSNVNNSVNVTSCTFESNESIHGGAIFANSKQNYFDLKIENSIFNKNYSENDGSAISSNSKLNILRCDFILNSSRHGSVINNGYQFKCNKCNFKNNVSDELKADIHNNGLGLLKNCNFTNDSLESETAIAFNKKNGKLTFNNVSFKSDYIYIAINYGYLEICPNNNFEKHHEFNNIGGKII